MNNDYKVPVVNLPFVPPSASTLGDNLNVDLMSMKDTINMLVRLVNHDHDRLTATIERILEIELKLSE